MAECSTRKRIDLQDASSKSAGGTLYLIIIQLTSRLVTFAGNQLVLRYLSLNVLGIAVQLELFSASVLYFCRESLRVTLQRQTCRDDVSATRSKTTSSARAHQTQTIVNLSAFAILLGIPLTIGFGWLYYKSQSRNVEIQESSDFGVSLLIYAFATLIELFSEPCFVVIQERLLYKARAISETMAAVFKCAATCTTVLCMSWGQTNSSVLPFAIGQATYSLVLACGYLATVLPRARHDGFSMLPVAIDRSTQFLAGRFHRPLASLAVALYAQSVFKQILTQGDALVLGFLASLEDQGAFALASNYGGLIARLVFQPVEESSRNTFGSLLSNGNDKDMNAKSTNLKVAFKQLSDMLHLYSILAVFSSCFLYTALPLAVKILVGPRWFTADVSAILSIYCYHIPFIAYNGILDAFVTSAATPAELRQQSIWMVAITAGYLPATYVLVSSLHLGARGLVLGNMFNVLLRILWSCWFVTQFVKKNNYCSTVIRHILPSPSITSVGAVVAATLRRKDFEHREGIMGLIEALTICFVGGCIILFLDRDFLTQWLLPILPERLASKFKHTKASKSQ